MTVRELIARLLNCDMEANVLVRTDYENAPVYRNMTNDLVSESIDEVHLG